MSIKNHETYADITAELRALSKSEELSIGAQYHKDYPTVCGKPICVYLADLADRLDAWAKRDGLLRVPVDVWNDMARKVESADAMRYALEETRRYLPFMVQYIRCHWEDVGTGGYFDEIKNRLDAVDAMKGGEKC